jgi:hypothetical protein
MRDDDALRDPARSRCALYYEVRGSGPVLLMMPGGPADGGIFHAIVGDLAADHTVVTYDPRPLSHSTLEGPVDDQRRVGILADDASSDVAQSWRPARVERPVCGRRLTTSAERSTGAAAGPGTPPNATLAIMPPASVVRTALRTSGALKRSPTVSARRTKALLAASFPATTKPTSSTRLSTSQVQTAQPSMPAT